MSTRESTLEYILPLLHKLSPGYNLEMEITALNQVVADIHFEIGRRKDLGDELQSKLEKRVNHIHSDLMNLRSSYQFNTLDRKIALEQNLEKIKIEKIHVQEKTSHELLNLKKTLWHYWLELSRKSSAFKFSR